MRAVPEGAESAMSKTETSPRRSRSLRAAVVCAVALAGAGCVETISLGSGIAEEEKAPDDTLPIAPWFPSDEHVWEDLDADPHGCQPTLDTDLDGDGFAPNQGDCNDCDPDVGPN